MTTVRQSHFGGGEIAPEEQGHSASVLVQRGLATCRNAFSTQRGVWMNRAGTQMVATAGATASRLEPFLFSDDQTFVLELGALYIRFFTGGAAVIVAGVPLELVTPWAQPDLELLKFCQVGDVITVTHPSYAPREISRLADDSWTLTTVSLTPPTPVMIAGMEAGVTTSRTPIEDATHPLKDWDWLAAALVRRADGSEYETLAIPATGHGSFTVDGAWSIGTTYNRNDLVVDPLNGKVYRSIAGANLGNQPSTSPVQWEEGSKVALYPDRPAYLHTQGSITSGSGVVSDFVFGVRWYRGRSGVWGWIGDQTDAGKYLRDDGDAPDLSVQPKLGTNPFNAADKYPAVVAHFDQRRIFARTNLLPATFYGSALGDFSDFDNPFPVSEDDSFNFKLAQKQLEDIRWALGHERLLLGTGAGVWAVSGSQGDAIGAVSIQARKSTGNPGVSWLDPIAAGTRLLYQTARGNHIRDLHFDYNANAYIGSDVSVHGRHLLDGFFISDWCYQEHPYSIVWAVRSDGKLLSLTYDATQTPPILAWALHDTGDGDDFFEHCCCIPDSEGTATATGLSTPDGVYFIVRRGGGNARYIERLADRNIITDAFTTTTRDIRTATFLDASTTVAQLNIDSTKTVAVTGASFAAADEVTVTAVGFNFGATAADFPLYQDSDVVMGVLGEDAPEIRIRLTTWVSPTVAKGLLQEALPAEFQAVVTTDWGYAYSKYPVANVALQGRELWALADGVKQGPFTPAGANHIIVFDPPALYIVLGLRYDSDGELLDLPGDASKGNVKSVDSVTLDVVASRGWKVGQDFDHLSTPKLRQVTDGFDPPPLLTDRYEVPIKGTWNLRGRVCWRQADPLPLTVVAVTRDVTYGGKP